MSATTTRKTAEAYFATSVEGDHTQLVDGEIVVNEPRPIHAQLQITLATSLRAWTDAAGGRGLALLPTDVVIDEWNVFGPDVIWIAERHRPADLRKRLARAPDLCAEIRSPGTWRYDIGRKKAIYEEGRLPELWLIDDVAETVLVFRRTTPQTPIFDVALEFASEDALRSPQLPGFELSLRHLFAA